MLCCLNQLTYHIRCRSKAWGASFYWWIDDVTAPTMIINAYDWGKLGVEESATTEFVVVENFGTQDITLSLSDTLDSSYGTVEFLIEWYDISSPAWRTVNWNDEIKSGTPYKDSSYIYGTPQNPLEPSQQIGFRPANPVDKDIGHIWIKLTIASDPPGSSTTFVTTATATEYIP